MEDDHIIIPAMMMSSNNVVFGICHGSVMRGSAGVMRASCVIGVTYHIPIVSMR